MLILHMKQDFHPRVISVLYKSEERLVGLVPFTGVCMIYYGDFLQVRIFVFLFLKSAGTSGFCKVR